MCAFHFPEEELISYDACRVKFPTEYDRVNPASADSGTNDYAEFIQERKKED